MKICAMMLLALILCACGDGVPGNTPGNNVNPAPGGEGYGDDHGAKTEIGTKELPGGYTVQLFQVKNNAVSEGIFEVYVRKGGELTKDISVDVWFGKPDGTEVSPYAPGAWMDDRQAFDCHVMIPPDGLPADPRVWVRLRRDNYKERTNFPFTK